MPKCNYSLLAAEYNAETGFGRTLVKTIFVYHFTQPKHGFDAMNEVKQLCVVGASLYAR